MYYLDTACKWVVHYKSSIDRLLLLVCVDYYNLIFILNHKIYKAIQKKISVDDFANVL